MSLIKRRTLFSSLMDVSLSTAFLHISVLHSHSWLLKLLFRHLSPPDLINATAPSMAQPPKSCSASKKPPTWVLPLSCITHPLQPARWLCMQQRDADQSTSLYIKSRSSHCISVAFLTSTYTHLPPELCQCPKPSHQGQSAYKPSIIHL